MKRLNNTGDWIILFVLLITYMSTATASVRSNVARLKQTCECPRCDLTGVNLQGFQPAENKSFQPHMQGARYITKTCQLKEANLSNSNLSQVNFSSNLIRHCTASRKFGCESVLAGADFSQAKLEGSNLSQARLAGVNLVGTSFKNSNLYKVDLTRSRLTGADFSGANLIKAHADPDAMNGLQADMRNAKFISANLKDARFAALFKGASFAYANLQNTILITTDDGRVPPDAWKGVDFSNANLIGANIGSPTIVVELIPMLHPDVEKQAIFCHTVMPDGSVNDRDCVPGTRDPS